MAPELAGSQISALLEAVPGIANVLRSPVADAMVNLIRAAAGLGEFRKEEAEELIQYAVRRGLIGPAEGERVLAEVGEAAARRKKARAAAKRAAPKSGSRAVARKGGRAAPRARQHPKPPKLGKKRR
jgi:hypothetical protein